MAWLLAMLALVGFAVGSREGLLETTGGETWRPSTVSTRCEPPT